MTREVEAIFEDGVLKPVEPLPFADKERVMVTVSNVTRSRSAGMRRLELAWLKENAHRYKGEYVALQDDNLISHGQDGHLVIAEARRKGFEHALFHYIPESFGDHLFELF